MADTVVLFTRQSTERILREGGSGRWRLVPSHARQCKFAVCTRNAKHGNVEGSEPHRSAFLVGRIKDIMPSREKPGRYWIQFGEYARVDKPDVWNKGDRNPVRYSTTEEIGIDPLSLNWEPMPITSRPTESMSEEAGTTKGLTMAEAKQGLAITFGVPPEAIEITIRG
jgi:hypothetical protein